MLLFCFIVLFCSVHCDSEEDDLGYGLTIGNSIDVFEKFGHLSIYMRVVPPFVPSDTGGWLFRRPTLSVFRDVERYSIAPNPRHAKTIFHGELNIEFCDNLQQLLQAYFRDFSFEGLERPWRAFTAGWPIDIMARNLGIDPSFIIDDHRFVLVRASRFRESRKLSDLPGNIDVYEDITEAIQKTSIEDMASLAVFIRNYGSHYIASYVTGDSLYQVFVFSRRVYARIKTHVKSSGMSDIPITEINNIYSPLFAVHVGAVKVASGNKTVAIWAAEHLQVNNNIFSYPSLLKLHGEPTLLRSLDTLLGNEALLQLELKTLSPAFKDVKKKKWFEEVIDNYLKLWDGNI